MRILVVVNMQNDYITGSLGTPEAQAIVPNVINKIKEYASYEDLVLFTKDTHNQHYLDFLEGENLPIPHCLSGSDGWHINKDIRNTWLENKMLILEPEYYDVKKNNTVTTDGFGSVGLANLIFDLYRETCEVYHDREIEEIELVGLCTDLSVISNALMLKTMVTEIPIAVDSFCCAGLTPKKHATALAAMEACQIIVR